MKKSASLLVFLLLLTVCFSQEKSVAESYTEYFKLPRETLFLHTNKTTYLTGEEVWFKVYAYNRKSQLTSKGTTNIRLGIFDREGKVVDQKLFLAKNGFAKGSIEIDSTFASGNYYLKVSTNWMKNFKEDDSFVKKIKVRNPASEEKKLPIQPHEYDIQFLPEGGHLLAEVKNTVGVKILDDTGKGTKASGSILDANGNEVTNFTSNFIGLGKFSFTPLKDQTYRAIVTLANEKKVELNFPKAKNRGIAIEVNNLSPKDVIITLSTNTFSFNQVSEYSPYTLLIHKDGIAKQIPLEFKTLGEKIVINKKVLFKGINTLTLLDKNKKPLVERMFFNEAFIKEFQISLQRIEATTDSISYEFLAGLTDNSTLNASVSVLPKGTKSYNPKHTILSAFYLKPYLKGSVENPSYYFTGMNRKKRYALDLLLLTQGWSRYNWNDIFKGLPETKYTFNNGLNLSGNLNNNLKSIKKLMLFPPTRDKSQNIEYDQNGRFELKNFLLTKDENLIFTTINKRGKTRKPKLIVNLPQSFKEEPIDVKNYQYFQSYYNEKNSALKGFVSSNTTVLDEIVVEAKLEEAKRKKYKLKKSGTLYNVTTDLNRKHVNLASFLRVNGFDVDLVGNEVRHLTSITNPVIFFLDNVQLTNVSDVTLSPLFKFEDIFIDATLNNNLFAEGGNVSMFATVVKLYTRSTPISYINAESPYEKVVKVPFGFEATKTFYTPKYGGFDTELFQNFGVIHWTPDFVISNNEIQNIKTVNTGLSEVSFYIEGIISNGDLISQVVNVGAKQKED